MTLKGLFITMLFVCFSLSVIGCATNPSRQFNNHDIEDYECYRDGAGRIGYCEK